MRITRQPQIIVVALVVAFALAMALAAALSGGSDRARAAETESERPNILLVVTDDQTTDSFNRRVMPNTKKLIAAKGTTFTDAIVSTPTCCPSRATMLTGQYAHNTGVTSNVPGYKVLKDRENTLPVWLSQAGYRTAHLGKYLNGYEGFVKREPVAGPGWEEWHTLVAPRRYYDYSLSINGEFEIFGEEPTDHLTRVLNRRTTRLIRRFSPGPAPFYIQLDHFAPHTERDRSIDGRCGGGAVPDPRDAELFDGERLPKPPSFNEADVSDKPSFVRERPHLASQDKKKIKRRYECRLASLTAVDRGIGKIVKQLKELGELDETVIIFVSDNGYFQGEHRIKVNKTLAYEEALRVPLAIRAPRSVRRADRIAKVKRTVSNVDLAPTILQLAGAKSCNEDDCRVMDGRSVVPLLRGRGNGRFPVDRAILVEYDRGTERQKPGSSCKYAGVWTAAGVYVEHTRVIDPATTECVDSDERELYDLRADPFELENLYPAFPGTFEAQLQQELEGRLKRLRDCAGIAGRDPKVEGRPRCE